MGTLRAANFALVALTFGCGPALNAPAESAPSEKAEAPFNPSKTENQKAADAAETPKGERAFVITVTNPLAVARPRETISVDLPELVKSRPGFDAKKAVVVRKDGSAVLSQLVDNTGDEAPDELVFQTDLAASETLEFGVLSSERKAPGKDEYKVYGRFVRERLDDFVWENDRVAFRAYGPALETASKEALISSGIDAWVKRVPRLLANDWYQTGNYHEDHGEGADYYSVGKTRGCGGVGVFSGGKLFVSKNFTSSRVLANGPIRLVFELTYAAWAAGGPRVSEVKRVTLDAGSNFNHFASSFTGGPATIAVGVGISKHAGSVAELGAAGSSLRTWEPLKSGNLGCAVVLPPGVAGELKEVDENYVLVAPARARKHDYFVGSAWDQGGQVKDAAGWKTEVEGLSARLAAPVTMKVTSVGAEPTPPAATTPAASPQAPTTQPAAAAPLKPAAAPGATPPAPAHTPTQPASNAPMKPAPKQPGPTEVAPASSAAPAPATAPASKPAAPAPAPKSQASAAPAPAAPPPVAKSPAPAASAAK